MKIGPADNLEILYMARFRQFASQYGTFVEYQGDKAARDIGLHFTQLAEGGGRIVTPALVWFQMKGISAGKLSKEQYEAAEAVSLQLQTNHLRFWYVAPEPTYLVVYVESADQFLVFNIKEWVAAEHGEAILTATQRSFTVSIDKKNVLDDQTFRIMLRKNLVSVVRQRLGSGDDVEARRFLAASEVVKWLDDCRQAGVATRLVVRTWISKTRTEVLFLSKAATAADWDIVREHWQYLMGPLIEAFPYIALSGGRQARIEEHVTYDEYDGEVYPEAHTTTTWLDDEVADEMDYEDIDGEGWMALGGDLYAYGDVAGGEYVEHEFDISLNELGESWLATLKVMEDAEVIVVGKAEGFISVAPWHARDL
jgi:hypothetical protein